MYSFSKVSLAIIAVLASASLALPVAAQTKLGTNVAAGQPCCSITEIDAAKGTVTVKTIATGKTFQFQANVAPAADFSAKSGFGPVDGFSPVDGFTHAGRFQPVDGYQPVDGARLFATLKVGQKIWASVNGLVSLNGGVPCCSIILKSP